MAIDRRQFVRFMLASSVGSQGLFAKNAIATDLPQDLVSAYKRSNGSHGVASINKDSSVSWTSDLPVRVHDCIFSPGGQEVVAFARRPGTGFWSLDTKTGRTLKVVHAVDGRHYYGHGCFGVDGKLLFTTENDFENARGVIGLYDTKDYSRVGEYPSYGVGPHDICLLPDGQTLAIANGGIETHPSTGREKLNLPFMQSSLSLVDVRSGALMKQYTLPQSLSRLSIRHLVQSTQGVFFACQYEGGLEDRPSLVGSLSRNGEWSLWPTPDNYAYSLRNYINSIAIDPFGKHLVTTSSKAGIALVWNIESRSVQQTFKIADCSGAAFRGSELYLSSGGGELLSNADLSVPSSSVVAQHSNIFWDNHMTARILSR